MSTQENRLFKLKIRKPRNLKNDFLSGLTVSLALIPEAIAFAFVAGIDPTVGLYAAFMMGLITAIFGGRPGMISGATGAVAVIFAPLVDHVIKNGTMDEALGYLFAAVILMGIVQILFGALKLGKFIRMVPHPVMLGFVNGLAIIIFQSQFEMFQIGHGPHAEWITGWPLALMLGLIAVTMLISHFLPKITKAIPATLVAIVVVTLISVVLNNNGIEVRTVMDFVKGMDADKESLAATLPFFALPNVPINWDTLMLILPYALLAASVGLIESLMTLTLVDELTETRGRGNKESIGQGLANVVNGFFGGMGGCAMIGQSMINIRAGGRGRTSGITAAIALLVFIVWGSKLVEIIPLAALVGVMFMVVIATFEWSSIRLFGKIPHSDFLVIIVVSVVTILTNLAIAVLAGILLSALVFVWEKGKLIKSNKRTDKHGTLIYELDGALFFGSATNFKELFDLDDEANDIVIDFAKARVHDHSGVEAINNITERYAAKGKKLHLYNLSAECRDLINKAENITEITIIEDLEWHLADDSLA